ncbi:MAG: hypothetical protein CVT99_14295 [Bacteroidetes bacterium HGW-Bacteroidetes-16]|jgi:PAS domain S-box-containing protein|nr:MAG: hypothetical protein CVT99_14295 [Bacteroidetes bacterium HGW-Bacteroidetes-16]
MKIKPEYVNPTAHSEIIRQKAETLLKEKSSATGQQLTEAGMQKLIHELMVHQIELELQNEELELANERATTETQKFTELYDSAPTGYFTLSIKGEILGLNLRGAGMLGTERSLLINTRFGLFVSDDTKAIFNLFLGKVFNGKAKESCEVALSASGESFIHVQLTGMVTGNSEQCFLTVVDITELRQAEKERIESCDERYKLLYDNVKIGLYRITPDGTILLANNALIKMLGYSSFGELAKININQNGVVSPLQRKEFIRNIEQSGELESFESTWTRKDGTPIFVRESARTICDTKGNTMYYDGTVEDITKRRQVDEALKKSELRFKQISENSQESIWEVDNTGLYTYISPVIKELLGYEAEEIIGHKYFYDLFEPENKEEMKQGAFGVFARKESFRNFVNCNIHKEGRKVILSTSGVPMLDNENNLIGYRGVDVDITERKQAEEALIESETRARALIDAIPDLIFRLNKQGVYLDYKAAKEDLAFQAESIIGKKNRDMMPPEFADLVDEKINLTLQTRQMQVFEYQLLLPLKGLREYEARMVPCSFDEVIVIVRDVTERKNAEEMINMLAHAVKNSADCIAISDKDYKIIFVNDTFSKVYGFENDEIVGQPISIIASKNNLPGVDKSLYCAIAKKEVWTGEVLNTKKDGNDFPVQLSLAPVITDKGEVIAVVGVLRDITERRNAEAELKLKNEQLLKLNAEKDKFFSIIAHDLRSPFNGFMGLTQLLTENTRDLTIDEIHKISVSMRNSATNLFRLLENLLQWARMQQGLIPFNPKALKLLPVVDECIEMHLASAKIKGIEISIDVPSEMEAFADCDMLQTVIRNLVSNAVKFTPRGGRINFSAKTGNDKSIIISISDTGIGMGQEMIGKLFNLDVQANRRGTEGEPSTGLGLLLCNEFIDKHGGKLWVESEEKNLPAGKAGGSTFYFTLP